MPPSERFVVTTDIPELRRLVAAARRCGHSIGCVPTMGALHQGHRSLFERARQSAGFVVATLFVNPTQFGPHEDFDKYPRPIEADLAACRESGVDLVFLPRAETIYPPGFDTWVDVHSLADVLEGAVRPGHFRGVATVVLKLLNIVQPHFACFGQKDYQQQVLIRRMVRDLDLPVEIITCPTVREADGLAMSSRNAYLSPAERTAATVLSRGLRVAEEQLSAPGADPAAAARSVRALIDSEPLATADYVAVVDPETLEPLSRTQSRMAVLVAARIGSTRLIDNCVVELPETPADGAPAPHPERS